MDPVALSEFKLEVLKDQAERADSRIAELNQELLLHRGGSQHLGQVMGLVEGHRSRLLGHAKEQADKGEPLAGQAEAEHNACQAGIIDALTYMRAQVKAAELSATRADAALQEMGRHRADLGAQGRQQAGKVDALMAEVEKGVPREMAGRPEPAETVRQKLDALKQQEASKESSSEPTPPKRGRRAVTSTS